VNSTGWADGSAKIPGSRCAFRRVHQAPPGFEIKLWFPLATEMTARFRDSQNHFKHDQTHVLLLAWMPERVIFGKPQIIDVIAASGLSIAKARDEHYHNPPDYLVIEPNDTSTRTRNLQQTNTAGYKWQGTPADFRKAQQLVASWGANGPGTPHRRITSSGCAS